MLFTSEIEIVPWGKIVVDVDETNRFDSILELNLGICTTERTGVAKVDKVPVLVHVVVLNELVSIWISCTSHIGIGIGGKVNLATLGLAQPCR